MLLFYSLTACSTSTSVFGGKPSQTVAANYAIGIKEAYKVVLTVVKLKSSSISIMATKNHKILTKDKLISIINKIEDSKDVHIINTELKEQDTQGMNYMGDIIFVEIKAKVNGVGKEYRLGNKTATSSQHGKDASPEALDD